MNPTPNSKNNQPLESWKEIANYLQRDVRTVARWEKSEGLPVHRHEHRRGASVYAYPSEIDAWRAARRRQAEGAPSVPLWKRMEAWAVVGVGVTAVLVITYGPFLNPQAPVAEAAEDSMRMEQVWTDGAASASSRLSPDGNLLSYTDWSTGELWLRETSTGQSRQITDEGSWDESRSFAETSAVSPDGKWVATAWYNHKPPRYELRVSPIPGPGKTNDGRAIFKSPEDQASSIEVVGWLSESRILFVHALGFTTTQLVIADVEKKKTTILKTLGWSYPADIAISPDGHWIAYGQRSGSVAPQHDIHMLATDGSTEHMVVTHPADDIPVAWTPDGSHLMFRSVRTAGQSLWALPMAEGEAAGKPRMVSPDVAVWRSLGLSSSGDLYFLKRTGSRDVFEARIDLESGRLKEKTEPVAVGFVGNNIDPAYSPDGRKMAYLSDRALHAFGGYASRMIVIRDLESGEERELKTPQLAISEIGWAPDSSSVIFKGRTHQGRFGAYQFDIEGANPKSLFQLPMRVRGNPRNFGWMNGGRSIFYLDRLTGQYMVHDLSTGEARTLIKPEGNSHLTLSPDGAHFARMEFRDTETPFVLLLVVEAKTGTEQEVTRFAIDKGDCCPPLSTAWAPDGQHILYWRDSLGRKGVQLWIASLDGREPRKTELAVKDLAGPSHAISLNTGGERISFSAGSRGHEIWKLSNFLDRLTASD